MKRIMLSTLILLCVVLISCGKDDEVAKFPVGSWKLSAIVFENGANKHELASGRLNQMTIEFDAGGTARSRTNNRFTTLEWSYDEATASLYMTDGDRSDTYAVELTAAGVFRYEIADIATMGSPSADQVAMAELAANTYNQSKSRFDPSQSLKVYFKFEQL